MFMHADLTGFDIKQQDTFKRNRLMAPLVTWISGNTDMVK